MAFIIEYTNRVYGLKVSEVWHPMFFPPIENYFDVPEIQLSYWCGCKGAKNQLIKPFGNKEIKRLDYDTRI